MNTIKPIKTDADYDAALAEIDALMDAESETSEGDRLDVLVTLVEAYEAKHWRIDPPDPIEAIKLRMQQRGLSRCDLEKVLGSKSRVSEVLNRKRPLTLDDDPTASLAVGDTGRIAHSANDAEAAHETRSREGSVKRACSEEK